MAVQTYQAPGGSYTYSGNNDYRGYLSALSQSSDPYAAAASQLVGSGGGLGLVDNNGRMNYTPAGSTLGNINNELYSRFNQFQAPNYLSAIGGGGAVAAPNWDINSIYNNAGGQAAAQVNPYYTKQLSDFQANQAKAQALQQQQRDLTLQNLQHTLDTQLQSNETSRGRTSQDVLTNEQQLGQQADYRQQDQGTQFDQSRIAQAKAQATGGLTGAGLGAQQTQQAQTQFNTQESRQAAGDVQQVAAQELTKARTFEDLANSDTLSQYAKSQGDKQSQIDWDKFVQGQASDLQGEQQTLEQSRLAQLSTVQKQLAQQQLNSMIHGLSNPAQRLAAASAYGGSF